MIIHMISEHASPLAALGEADAGGQNVHVAALAVALARRGHEVTVYTRRDDSLPDRVPLAPGVLVEHVDAGPSRPIPKDQLLPYMDAFAEQLGARWRTDRPDIVHSHFWMSGLAALAATRDLGIPVVQTFHALGVVKRRHQGSADTSPSERLRLECLIARQAELIIATSSEEVRELRVFGVAPDAIAVVPCGVDRDRFRPDGPVAGRGGRTRVLSIGRLVARKGMDTIIEAMASVPAAELLIGGGPDPVNLDDDPEVRRLRAVARAHGVSDRVIFLGRVPHDEVPALMRSADVVVSTPWYEPFGIVPIEAMACGRPVIGSAVGGHLDTIVDGVTGLHVPPRDPAVLAQRLRQLLANRRWRAALGRAGAETAGAHYSWDRVAVRTEAAYKDVTATPHHDRWRRKEGRRARPTPRSTGISVAGI